MDTPPAIVIETTTCGDTAQAASSVRESMRAATAPKEGWTLRISNTSEVRIEGVLEDDLGMPVAHRALYLQTPHDCEATMHGLGVWASLVLDAQVTRARERERAAALPKAVIAEPALPPGTVQIPSSRDAVGFPFVAPGIEPADAAPRAPHRPLIDVGMSSLLGGGIGGESHAYLGVGLFTFIEAGHHVFLRPSVSYGHSLEQGEGSGWGHTRFDVCARAPGNYIERRGLQFDACLGTEAGVMGLGQQPRFLLGFGPAISLRGELGGGWAVEVRSSSAYNAFREDTQQIAPLTLRGELGVSWAVR